MAEATAKDARDTCEELTAKLIQLQAQATLITGEGFAAFKDVNDTLQSNYIWGIQCGISECVEMVHKITTAVYQQARA